MEILAIIPARGGSKGLPGKNIKNIAGHPLISYSILAAQKVSLINRIIVSTDDPKIAEISLKYGAEVPIMRPMEFASDFSTDFDVFFHMLTWLKENENYIPDFVVQLRPTSPVRQISHISDAINKLIATSYDSLRIVTEAPITPYKMWTIQNENSPMLPIINQTDIKEPFNQPRQKLPNKFWQIGYLDVIRTDTILNKKSISGSEIIPFIVEQQYAIDIDNLQDFLEAENFIKSNDCIKY
jgi:CMP-N,N'-diacetyllegionaminic acid synthase